MDLWLTTVGVLARSLAKDGCQPLRDNAIMVLRCEWRRVHLGRGGS